MEPADPSISRPLPCMHGDASPGQTAVGREADGESEDRTEDVEAGLEPANAGGSTEEPQTSEPAMTKSARKRMLKRELQRQMYEKKKETKKRLKQEKQAEKRKAQLEASPGEATARVAANRAATRHPGDGPRERPKDVARARLKAAISAGVHVVVDLDYFDLMSEGQVRSMVQQCMFSYAANNRAPTPVNLRFVGVSEGMRQALRRIPGQDHWLVDVLPDTYKQLYRDRKQDVVYLTADSPNTLDDIDPAKVYVLGGLVDRNFHKNITLERAAAAGVSTAKFPIKPSELGLHSSCVLTTNQALQVILYQIQLHDWTQALLRTIPGRKIGERKPRRGEGKGAGDGAAAGSPSCLEEGDDGSGCAVDGSGGAAEGSDCGEKGGEADVGKGGLVVVGTSN